MFDFAWSEIVLIGAVALIAIGPKDMPAAIRTVSSMVKKARRMAAEFQTHVDEMVREADLGDVKKAFNDIRNFDIPGALEKAVDPDRSLRKTFEDNPLEPTYPTPSEVSTLDEVTVSAPPVFEPLSAPEVPAEPPKPLAPAFIPPGMVPPPVIEAAKPPVDAPAFIPPEVVLQRQSKA
ncbi:MAG: Sec-independent protein translocase protein TatB [Rhodopila sp.]|nr:Sec-independent protein translocase protein TatB [Rhodopila sp.]